MPCFRFWAATNDGNRTLQLSFCGQSASYAPIPGDSMNSAYFVIDGVVRRDLIYWGPPHALRGIELNTNPQGNDCLECRNENPPPPRYDCINGSCLEKSQYGTPGIYESLAVCEQNCGLGCGGMCVSNADWVKIGNLAAMIKNKDCS